jgi:threonine dehydrogenase-like Zn-dependent dehydrogenase
VELRELPLPEPQSGAAIVEVVASTVCGTDVHLQNGDFSHFARLPLVLGHEIVGRLVALGQGRTRDVAGRELKEGDLVAWSYAWCGRCYWCVVAKQATLCEQPRMYGWGPADQFPYLTGGFADYCYVLPECGIIKVPDGVDPAVAAAATCSFRTVVHGFERLGGIQPWETVVVQGSGPVGLWSVALAIASGARQVLVIGAPAQRLELARRWGAAATFDIGATTQEQRREEILAKTDGRRPDVVIEASGAGVALAEGLTLVRRGGRYLVIGQGDPRPVEVDGRWINTRQLTLVGVLSGEARHYYWALQFLADNHDRFPFAAMLGSAYALDSVESALSAMRSMQEIKPVVLPHAPAIR